MNLMDPETLLAVMMHRDQQNDHHHFHFHMATVDQKLILMHIKVSRYSVIVVIIIITTANSHSVIVYGIVSEPA